MATDRTLSQLRSEFGRSRMLALPIAGTIAWSAAGVFGAFLDTYPASIALFCCMAAIFPLGLLIARLSGENWFDTRSQNDLDRLFGLNVLMANLVWAIAIPFWWIEKSSLPLSVGILAGLMWVPFSWMLQHWVGLFHAIARTVLVVAAWFLFPAHRFLVVPVVIIIVYVISIIALATRRLPEPASPSGG
jgi:hypothetical protein